MAIRTLQLPNGATVKVEANPRAVYATWTENGIYHYHYTLAAAGKEARKIDTAMNLIGISTLIGKFV